MRTKASFMSRCAAMIIALLAAMHLLITLDLFLNFFPDTQEFRAMWAIAAWAKILWVVLSVVGAAAVVLLYRRPWLGFIASFAFCACLYFASVQLWGEVKGGFWLAIGACILAGIGAARSGSTFKPNSTRESA